jgi:hypothetical protein
MLAPAIDRLDATTTNDGFIPLLERPSSGQDVATDDDD